MIQPATQADLENLLAKAREDPSEVRNVDKDGVNYAIRSHAAKGPIIIRNLSAVVSQIEEHPPYAGFVMGSGSCILMDKKDPGYPNKKLAGKVCGWGGNWNNLADKTPEDVYRRELGEEFRELEADGKTIRRMPLAELMQEGKLRYFPLGEYFGVTPESAHGNPKIGLYLNPVTWFVGIVDARDLANALGLQTPLSGPDDLQKAINNFAEFHSSALFRPTDERLQGAEGLQFAWGDDYLLEETLRVVQGSDIQIPKAPDVQMFRLTDVPINAPYASRWTTQHDFLNPIRKGSTADAAVFAAAGNG